MRLGALEILILLGLALALICFVLLIAGTIFMVSRSRRSKPAPPPSTPPPLSQPLPVAANAVPKECPQCQAPLAANAPEGLCPACLAKAALDTEPSAPSDTINVNPPAEAAPGTRVPPKPADLAGQFPQLEILELLGMGGMGLVYKARQPRVDRLVALKILPMASMPDASFAERFEREAKALAKLNHPGIVTLYDFGQTREYYYFIMEFVDGMNLRHLIQAKTLEPRQALELVMQICTALQFAHDEKIVHRDIKPENILITKRGQVKIADFGLAKLLGSQPDTSLTASQQVMGTVNYMAPEQRENTKDVDHRADIYSLGVVFYEMLTGEVPMGRFEPPSKKVQVDVRLDEVVLHALEREPARRYQHVSEVKTGVEAITSAGPAAPLTPLANPPRADSAGLAPRRDPLLLLGLALMGLELLTVLLPAGAFLWFNVQLHHPELHYTDLDGGSGGIGSGGMAFGEFALDYFAGRAIALLCFFALCFVAATQPVKRLEGARATALLVCGLAVLTTLTAILWDRPPTERRFTAEAFKALADAPRAPDTYRLFIDQEPSEFFNAVKNLKISVEEWNRLQAEHKQVIMRHETRGGPYLSLLPALGMIVCGALLWRRLLRRRELVAAGERELPPTDDSAWR